MIEPPSPFQLHPMRLKDIDAVLAIDRHSFPTPARANLYRYELSQNDIAHYQVLTVHQGDQPRPVVGYAGFWMIGGELHVSTIAVDPAWRGRGLGELLLLNMLFMANDLAAHLATLEVRQSNGVAQALYAKYQFEVVGRRPRYYRDTGEDAILMTVSPLDAEYYHFLERQRNALFRRLVSKP